MPGAVLPQWAIDLRETVKDQEARIRVLEKTRFMLFGIGTGVGAIATFIGSGSLKAVLKALT